MYVKNLQFVMLEVVGCSKDAQTKLDFFFFFLSLFEWDLHDSSTHEVELSAASG